MASVVGLDVNILIYLHRQDHAEHRVCRQLWEDLQRRGESVGVPDVVLSSFLRIVTHPGIYCTPTPVPEALRAVNEIRSADCYVPLNPGPLHWDTFQWLIQTTQARGNLVTDAYLAALAIERGCDWISADRDFALFPGLRWRNPLDGENASVVLP
jgi:uncharacterized protein